MEIIQKKAGTPYTWKDMPDAWNSARGQRPWNLLAPLNIAARGVVAVDFAAQGGRTATSQRVFMECAAWRSSAQKLPNKRMEEQIAIKETTARRVTFARTLVEAAVLAEGVGKRLARAYQDGFALRGDLCKRPHKNAQATLQVAPNARKHCKKLLQTLLRAAPTVCKRPYKPFADGFSTGEALSKTVGKNVRDPLIAAEYWLRRVIYRRNPKEAAQLREALFKRPYKNLQCKMELFETYLRNINAVLSNLYYANRELTFAEFRTIETPAGFRPFRDFVIGDYSYEQAIFRLMIEGAVMAARPLVTDWQLNVDVPDISDRGTLTVPAAGCRVNFTKRFYSVPEVNVAVRGGLDVMPEFDADQTGFSILLRKADGTTLAGVVSWSANGY